MAEPEQALYDLLATETLIENDAGAVGKVGDYLFGNLLLKF